MQYLFNINNIYFIAVIVIPFQVVLLRWRQKVSGHRRGLNLPMADLQLDRKVQSQVHHSHLPNQRRETSQVPRSLALSIWKHLRPGIERKRQGDESHVGDGTGATWILPKLLSLDI